MNIGTDYAFYSEVFGGKYSEDEIMPFIRAAEDVVSCCVRFAEESALSSGSERLKRASCIQGEYYAAQNGGYTSVKLGDFAMSADSPEKACGTLCPRAYAVIEEGGLFYRGGVRLE